MNAKNMTLTALVLGLGMSFGAQAGDFGRTSAYTFAEAGANKLDVSGPIDADGFYVRGSYELAHGVYVAGRAQQAEIDQTNVKVKDYDLGLGMHRDFGAVDGFGEVAYQRSDALGARAEGYRVGAGIKVPVASNLEGLVQVNYRDGQGFDSETSGVLGARYSFAPNWSVNASGEVGDGAKLYNLGLRYSF